MWWPWRPPGCSGTTTTLPLGAGRPRLVHDGNASSLYTRHPKQRRVAVELGARTANRLQGRSGAPRRLARLVRAITLSFGGAEVAKDGKPVTMPRRSGISENPKLKPLEQDTEYHFTTGY